MSNSHRGRSSRTRRKRRRDKESSSSQGPPAAGPDHVECTSWLDRFQGRRRYRRKAEKQKKKPLPQTENAPLLPHVERPRGELQAFQNLLGLALALGAIFFIVWVASTYSLVVDEEENHSGNRIDRFRFNVERKDTPTYQPPPPEVVFTDPEGSP